MEWDRLYKNLKVLNLGILLLLTSVSCLVMSLSFTTGIVIGSLIAITGFHMLQRMIRKGFAPERGLKTKKASIMAKSFLRLGAMGTLIYIVISRQWVHPVGLTIGLSIVVISIVIFGLVSVHRMYLEETT
jgi:hypothetical protein